MIINIREKVSNSRPSNSFLSVSKIGLYIRNKPERKFDGDAVKLKTCKKKGKRGVL